MLKPSGCLLIGLCLVASGCATVEPDTYGRKEGWRRARVVQVGDFNTPMTVMQKDCRTELDANSPQRRFAVVSYNIGGSPRAKARQISALPDDVDMKAGDPVYVNLRDCKAPLRKREVAVKNP